MSERFSDFQPMESADSIISGRGTRELRAERKRGIEVQTNDYFKSLAANLKFDYDRAKEAYPHALNVEFEIIPQAETIAQKTIRRNNQMSDVITSTPFKEVLREQKELRGACAIGEIDCIDGRIATAHTAGPAAGVHEAIGGCTDTSISKLTGEVNLKSQTLEQAIEGRPWQDSPQLLQMGYAHAEIKRFSPDGVVEAESNCGGMKKFQEEAAERGEPFSSDDLVAENFRLLIPSMGAITRTYNEAAETAGQPKLEKVAIRAVYDTRTQGTLLGYGEEKPFFSSALTEQLEPDMRDDLPRLYRDERLRESGYFRETFTRIDKYLEKEGLTTNIISYLLEHHGFQREMRDAADRLTELQGLTAEQQRALQFKIARGMAFQYLTGLHKKELSPEHPFSQHNERFQAITIDDGYGATVGKNDPEVQVFAANTATIGEAVDHVKTKVALMDHYSPQKPYVLFVSSGIAEDAMNNPDVRKQARAIVGRTFNGITQNDEIASLVTSGILIPVPAIVSSRSNRVVEVPNLLR